MLKLDAIVNTQQIFENSPSKAATHYHLARHSYLSLTEEGRLYIWCSVNEAWIETQSPLHEERLVLNLRALASAGVSFAGLHPCARCHSTTHNHIMVGRDGCVVLNCLSCGSVINVWRDIWEGVQKGAQPYTHVESRLS